MRNENEIRSIEVYLSALDTSLIAKGVDPNVRLDHVNQVAEVVVASGVDPDDEFGSPSVYAERLADAAGAARDGLFWLRALCAGLGLYFVVQGVALIDMIRWSDGAVGLVKPHEYFLPTTMLSSCAFFGVAFWMSTSPVGLRIGYWLWRTPKAWFYRQPVAARYLLVIAGLFAFLALVFLGLIFEVGQLISFSNSWTLVGYLAGTAAVSPLLLWWSGAVRFLISASGFRMRPGFLISYSPFRTQTVRFDRKSLNTRVTQ